MACVAFMIVGALLLRDGVSGDMRTWAAVCLMSGGSLLLLGIGVWDGTAAWVMRVAGWLLVAAALVVPSTLSLLLVVAAPLLFLVARSPDAMRERATSAEGVRRRLT